ncbi:unnamed protein product [Mytilus coruscus]|uniref:CCHC-type domain-containing protein n=1 Tax=Mytilus coruscus TaxID=42192 RepID=A0A6J8B8C9_MYTCO|nr:unnamed protein product [Mytilus coruscus]
MQLLVQKNGRSQQLTSGLAVVRERRVLIYRVESEFILPVSAASVIKSIEEQVGEGEILACVPKSGNLYEVTLNENDSVDLICDTGFKIGDRNFKPNAIFSKERLVSFLKVSIMFLIRKLKTSWKRLGLPSYPPLGENVPWNEIADGTRYVVIRFPDDKQSLPYSMKFSTGVNSHEYIRVIHDNQRKVCSKCYETDHIFATCPDNVCWRCKTSGHLSKSCPEPPCEKCKKFVAHCVCEVVWVDPIHANKDQQNHDDAEAENIEDNGDGDDEDAAADDADDDKNNDDDDERMDVKDDNKTVKNTVNVDVEVHNEQGTVSCVDVKSVSDELDLNEDENTTVDNLIVDNEQNKVSNFGGSEDMDLTNELASHLEDYVVTDSGQIKGSKSLMTNDMIEQEMTDEELAQNMLKMRRRRLGNNPNLSADDIKRLKREPRHKLSSSQNDHSFVVLNVDFSPVEKGPGLWIFNNTLLNDEYFVEKVDNLIENEKKCPLFESEMLVWIDNLKYKIKKFSQVYAKDKKKKEQTEYFRLQKEFQKISEKVANGKVFNENKYEEIKLEMQKYEEKICKGAILRSKADWAIDGDKNSAYFLQLEKHRQENNCIKELKDKNGIIISKTDKILDEIHQYYKTLFSCTNIDEMKMNELLSFISKTISENHQNYLDSEITPEEIFKSLNGMNRNKSPGGDGITVSFYLKFFHHFGEIFKKVLMLLKKRELCPDL